MIYIVGGLTDSWLLPLDASGTPSPIVTTKNAPDTARGLLGAQLPLAENHWSSPQWLCAGRWGRFACALRLCMGGNLDNQVFLGARSWEAPREVTCPGCGP